MAAFVVAPRAADGLPRTGERLDIFPGSATPSVFRAGEPFWIGFGFVDESHDTGGERTDTLDQGTRFDLEVDGKLVELRTDVQTDPSGWLSSMHGIANFDSGMPPGWHRFTGRWYVAGRLVLSSDTSIEFTER